MTILPSLLVFAFVMYITPGPNNVMVASSSATYGVRATLPHIFGIAAGFTLMLVVVSAGLGSAVLAWPPLLPAMRWIGAAWMLWLAWKIATAPSPGAGERGRLLGFFGAMAFQWINPKAWLIGLGAASEFLQPGQPLGLQLLLIAGAFLLPAMPSLLTWALIGSGAGRLLHSPGRVRAFNVAMAALLLLSLVPLAMEK